MPAQESAVMKDDVTGAVKAKATRAPKAKAKVDTSAIRAQIKEERSFLNGLKANLKESKAELRDILSKGKKDVTAAAKHLKLVTTGHLKTVKATEKAVATDEKVVAKQQTVINKLTAKLN